MNHKRGRPKNRRNGCLMCKPWKVNGYATERPEGEKHSDHVKRMVAEEEIDLYNEIDGINEDMPL